MAKITAWYADQLEEKARLIAYAYQEELSRVLKEKIAERRNVAWPNDTRRRNGITVGASRDIVDTGRLQLSQSLTRRDNGGIFTWNAPYARNVVEGRYPAQRPPRDWREWATDELPIAPYFLNRWRQTTIAGSAKMY